jgi:hypothetical protein
LAILQQNEDDGLVLQPANARQPEFVCSCCGCCCGMLSYQKLLPHPVDFWASTYLAEVSAAACSQCGTCVSRCQVGAVTLAGPSGAATVIPGRCICGLCVPPVLEIRPRRRSPNPPAPERRRPMTGHNQQERLAGDRRRRSSPRESDSDLKRFVARRAFRARHSVVSTADPASSAGGSASKRRRTPRRNRRTQYLAVVIALPAVIAAGICREGQGVIDAKLRPRASRITPGDHPGQWCRDQTIVGSFEGGTITMPAGSAARLSCMFILLPYQHDRMSVKRLPWVSISILALNLLAFVLTRGGATEARERAENALDADAYWAANLLTGPRRRRATRANSNPETAGSARA